MSIQIGVSRDRDVQRIATTIESFQRRPSAEGVAELSHLLPPPRELRVFLNLPPYTVRTVEGIYIEHLRQLAEGGLTLMINGVPRLAELTRDNLGDSCINGRPELFFRKGEIYGLEPLVRKIGFDIVVPIGVITGVAIGLEDKKRQLPNS